MQNLSYPQIYKVRKTQLRTVPQDFDRFLCSKKLQYQSKTLSQDVQTKHRRLCTSSTQPLNSQNTQTDLLNDIPIPAQMKILNSTKSRRNEGTQINLKPPCRDSGDQPSKEYLPKKKQTAQKDYPAIRCFKNNWSFDKIGPEPLPFLINLRKSKSNETIEIVQEPFSILARLMKVRKDDQNRQQLIRKQLYDSSVSKKFRWRWTGRFEAFLKKFLSRSFVQKKNKMVKRFYKYNTRNRLRRQNNYFNTFSDNYYQNVKKIVHRPYVFEELDVDDDDIYRISSESFIGTENYEDYYTSDSKEVLY